MIFTESTIKISNNVSKMDSTIVLYRGDKNVEIRFTILQSPFKYSNTVATNVIESTNASYGQLVIKTPNDKPPIFSEVSATKEGTVLFTITKEMIDEIEELGVYTFQIRLMDENKQSRVTIPPVENGIEIKEPIAIEDDNTTNVVGLAKANYAVATLSDVDTPTFDDNGKYNKTNWNDGDIITNASLNKIEDGIYTTNENVTATKKYVDDNILLEQLPILRIDETNKRIYVNCNNMGTYKKYFVPNKYANVYGFSFIYTNEDSSETEIALIGGAMTRDDFILCARNTDTLFILILGGTDKYKYTKSTKTLEKGLYGYLKIGNTQEYAPTENYNPATKKYVDDNMKTAINGVKGDLGTEELTTTAKNLRGAVNELNTQYKDIANKKIDNVTLSNNVLTFIANSKNIKTITLPTSTTSEGTNGKEIELQKSTTHIQWRYVGDADWINLVALADLKGIDGAKGDKGNTGATPNLQIGKLTTLDSGSNATATITGTAENPLLNLGIPKGAKGDKGDTGSSSGSTLVTTNISGTTLALTTDKYQTTTIVDGTEITLPTVTSFTEIHLFFGTTTDLTLMLPSCKWQNGNTPTISANKTYEFIFTYTTEWLGGVIAYE